MDWQPIETAPKDGTAVLLIVVGYEPAVGSFKDRGWNYMDIEDFPDKDDWLRWLKNHGPWEPTHWMPLPAPPVQS